MKIRRKIIEIDEALCNGCGECVTACAEGAIRLVDGKARLVSETYCDGLGACLGECPAGALKVVEREVEAFDEEAVKRHLAVPAASAPPVQGCPSMQARTFNAAPPTDARSASALGHWPVQIRLISPTAPFLRGARLLVAADCVPVAYPNFHQDFLAGRVVMVGCPKFDDTELYAQRFADIFQAADIADVTVVVMQVPCCQALPMVVQEGLRRSGKDVPVEKVVVSLEGQVLRRERLAA